MSIRALRHIPVTVLPLLVCLLLCQGPAYAGEESILNGLFSRSGMGKSHLTFDFDRLPTYTLKTSGQRIDLVLKNCTAGAGLKHLPEDDKVIKVLVARDSKNLVVSILLRRLPSKVVATPDNQIHQLKLAIRWNAAENVRPGIVFDLPDMPAVRRRGIETRHTSLARSGFQGNWLAFLKTSHTPINIEVPPGYSLPPAAQETDSEAHSGQGDWHSSWAEQDWVGVIEKTRETANPGAQYARIEAYLRLSRPEMAQVEINAIGMSADGPDQLGRLSYLKALSQVMNNRPYAALLSLTPANMNHGRWAAWGNLLRAEVHLGLGDAKKARMALKAIVPEDDPHLANLHELRWADALALSGDCNAALEAYARLPEGLAEKHPYSLARQVGCTQATSKHARSRAIFRLLSGLAPEGAARVLSRFGALTSYERPEEALLHLDELERLRWDNVDGEVAFRVMMKLTDLMAPGRDEALARRQLQVYDKVAVKAPLPSLRLEAEIKHAILLHVLKRDEEAIAKLEKTLRNFKRGALRVEALSLLGELLPATIQSQISKGHYLAALVLVERNRDLLIQQPLSWDFLHQVAKAFDRLELDHRADKIFLYLYDRAKTPTQKAEACLLLAKNYLQLGEYALVEQYCERYRALEPAGQGVGQSYELQLRARVALQGETAAIAWFDQQDPPPTGQLLLYAASLYWRQENYQKVVKMLELARAAEVEIPLQAALWQAEGYFRTGQAKLALAHFEALFGTPEASAQARYRAAMIFLDQQNRKKAIELLQGVAALDQAPRWRRIARDQLSSLNM